MDMKKIFLIGLLGFAGVGMMIAAPLTPEQALQRLNGSKARGLSNLHRNNPDLLFTLDDPEKQPALYVFGGAGEGYMILSADDISVPLLGYADSGYFDAENMPPQMRWWLDQYELQIREARKRGLRSSGDMVGIDPSWTAIEPMIKTKWDQDAPYYNDCPTYESQKCYTGCVATAMAQVMNYWKYPEKGTGRVVYKAEKISKNLLINFANYPFEWDSMLDVYDKGHYSDTEAAAVANLMKCAGYSVEMNYGIDSSGAMSFRIPTALKTYFNYDQNCRIITRNPYSVAEWSKIVYDNLKNVGPMVYDGQSDEGGHSFICDGYDGNGYFHFNWGWSGMSDGYYTLNALDPSALGIGGGGGGFNFDQDIIAGIQPPTGEPAIPNLPKLYQNASVQGSITSSTLSLSLVGPEYPYWVSHYEDAVVLKFGVICEPVNVTSGDPINISSTYGAISFPSYGQGIYQKSPTTGNEIILTFNLNNLKNGKYKVTLATQEQYDANNPWVPVDVPYGDRNYVYITRNGTTFTIENIPAAELKCEDFTLESDLYAGCLAQLNLKLVNNSELLLTKGIMPAIKMNGNLSFIGKSALYNVEPNSTLETVITTDFAPLKGVANPTSDREVTIVLLDPDSYNEIEGSEITATMKKNPGTPAMSLQALTIEGEKNGTVTEVKSKNHIALSAKLKVLRGYFAYPLYAIVLDSDGYIIFSQKVGDAATILSTGETCEFNEILDWPAAEPGVIYPLHIAYVNKDYRFTTIGLKTSFQVADLSGVDDLFTEEEEAPVKYFNLQGMEVMNPEAGQILIVKKGNKVSKTILK